MEELRKNTLLWRKLQIFVYDLQKFSSHAPSRHRLGLTTSPDYISVPYFTPEEADALRNTVVSGSEEDTMSLQQKIHAYFEARLQRSNETGDHGVCASHHLAPIFEKAFRISATELGKDKKFVQAVKKVDKKGLDALDC